MLSNKNKNGTTGGLICRVFNKKNMSKCVYYRALFLFNQKTSYYVIKNHLNKKTRTRRIKNNYQFQVVLCLYFCSNKNNPKKTFTTSIHQQKKHTKRVTKKETLEQEGTKIIIKCAVEIPENAPDRE